MGDYSFQNSNAGSFVESPLQGSLNLAIGDFDNNQGNTSSSPFLRFLYFSLLPSLPLASPLSSHPISYLFQTAIDFAFTPNGRDCVVVTNNGMYIFDVASF